MSRVKTGRVTVPPKFIITCLYLEHNISACGRSTPCAITSLKNYFRSYVDLEQNIASGSQIAYGHACVAMRVESGTETGSTCTLRKKHGRPPSSRFKGSSWIWHTGTTPVYRGRATQERAIPSLGNHENALPQ